MVNANQGSNKCQFYSLGLTQNAVFGLFTGRLQTDSEQYSVR